MKKLLSLFLTLAMLCAMLPAAYASTIYTAKEMKVKHDFQTEGVEDGKGTATYVDVEGRGLQGQNRGAEAGRPEGREGQRL